MNVSMSTMKVPTAPPAGVLDRLARSLVLGRIRAISGGEITVVESGEASAFGDGAASGTLRARVTVHSPAFYRRIALGGSVGAAEAYMDGLWSSDDLTALVRIMLRNRNLLDGLEKGTSRLAGLARRFAHWTRRNTLTGSRRNVEAHYDLGNELFALFLDRGMMYSCALFENDASSLEDAARAKNDRICRKLALSPADHLLEIGGGWGGFAIHAARHYGCRVTTTTISREQHDLAARRIAEAGVGDRVTLVMEDYRRLSGRYDKLVSIEMIEAVGDQYIDEYFRICGSLLKPDGVMLLQAITIADQSYSRAVRSADFVKRYIFPGSFIPSVAAVCSSVARSSDLRPFHLEDLTPHYARTLREWRSRFIGNLDRVRALGYPDEFIRMWDYYLCYCEGGFREGYLGDMQMMLAKPGYRRDLPATETGPPAPGSGRSTSRARRPGPRLSRSRASRRGNYDRGAPDGSDPSIPVLD